ncbi:MAG: macro domain-containing protein [Bryobacterales bacterium]|nr:macro domain-containing protein [Bryobacterales bacterium]
MEKRYPGGRTLLLIQGDITTIAADAIGNAANSGLRGGGGVDGAIHAAGGPAIMVELNAIRAERGGCPTGSAVATGAGNLPAKYVFHAVGPVYRGGRANEAAQLAACYRACLQLAQSHAVRRLSLPSISTGVYGYPVSEAAAIAIGTVDEELRVPGDLPIDVVFVLYDQRTFEAYRQALSARMLE